MDGWVEATLPKWWRYARAVKVGVRAVSRWWKDASRRATHLRLTSAAAFASDVACVRGLPRLRLTGTWSPRFSIRVTMISMDEMQSVEMSVNELRWVNTYNRGTYRDTRKSAFVFWVRTFGDTGLDQD
jgi:hypothetical protein